MTGLVHIAARACASFSVVAAATALALPSQLCGQQATWVSQLEGHVGWWLAAGYETQAVDASGNAIGVDLGSSLAFGVQASFPIATWPMPGGKLAIGAQGFLVPGAEMQTAGTDVPLGSADYYQLGATVSAGEFVAGTPITATLVPMLGIGVGHTNLKPDAGVVLSDEERSTTSLVVTSALGIDFLFTPAFNIVTQVGANLGIRGAADGTVTEWSFSFLGGIAIRLPLSGRPTS